MPPILTLTTRCSSTGLTGEFIIASNFPRPMMLMTAIISATISEALAETGVCQTVLRRAVVGSRVRCHAIFGTRRGRSTGAILLVGAVWPISPATGAGAVATDQAGLLLRPVRRAGKTSRCLGSQGARSLPLEIALELARSECYQEPKAPRPRTRCRSHRDGRLSLPTALRAETIDASEASAPQVRVDSRGLFGVASAWTDSWDPPPPPFRGERGQLFTRRSTYWLAPVAGTRKQAG